MLVLILQLFTKLQEGRGHVVVGSLQQRGFPQIHRSFTLSSAAASPPVTVSIASNILIIQNDNVNFQITVTYKSGCKNYALLTPNRRHLSKSIARGHKRGLVDHCFCDPETQRYIMNKLNRQVRGEVKKMCSDAVGSILLPHMKH